MKRKNQLMTVLKIVYFVGMIGLTLYSFGYIFGAWLATGQIDVSNLKILTPFVLSLLALLLAIRGKKKVVKGD